MKIKLLIYFKTLYKNLKKLWKLFMQTRVYYEDELYLIRG